MKTSIRQRFSFLRTGLLLLALTMVSASVALTCCKYITWYNTSKHFYFVDTYSYSAASVGGTGTPALSAITSTKGWWGYVMAGGGGGLHTVTGGGNTNGGYGGYLMGCVYVNTGETLYGLAGRAGDYKTSTASTDNAAYGGGSGHYGNGGTGNGSGVGGGGGASCLSKSSAATSSFAIAGGGGGGTNGGSASGTNRAGDGGNLGNATGTANGNTNTGNGNASQSGMSGANGATGSNDDEAGGGGGYRGGAKGSDPTFGYKKGGGGGSSYQASPGRAIPSTHWAYNSLSPYMGYAGSGNNGWIYLVYMGDNDDSTNPPTYTY